MQIYLEKGYDLLGAQANSLKDMPKVKMYDTGEGDFKLEGIK